MTFRSGGHEIYAHDSFFTLSIWGQFGLGTLSVLLGAGTVLAVRRAARGRHWPVQIVLGLVTLWCFLWLSPQIYYAYYYAIFDDLPVQIVIGRPPGPLDVLQTITFTGRATLSSHSAGLLGWLAVFAATARNS